MRTKKTRPITVAGTLDAVDRSALTVTLAAVRYPATERGAWLASYNLERFGALGRRHEATLDSDGRVTDLRLAEYPDVPQRQATLWDS